MLKFGCAGSSEDGTPPTTAPECQINSPAEKSPGFPFNLDKFGTDVLPVLISSCTNGPCHANPVGAGNFTVWKDAAVGNCNFGKTFNQVAAQVNLQTANNSPLLVAITGGLVGHPYTLQEGDANLKKLSDYVAAAVALNGANGGGETPGPGNSPFNYQVFESTIQPAVNTAGCAMAGCHGDGAGGFRLVRNPAPGSNDMVNNFKAITTRTNLTDPEKSTVYVRSTLLHGGGRSTQFASASVSALLAWIQDAKKNNGPGGGPDVAGCIPPDSFNQGVFESEILPILDGTLDLNEADLEGDGAGCMSSACHGQSRGPGSLTLQKGADVATLLTNFGCYVNLQSPVNSQIVLCPTESSACNKNHPGEDVFDGANDLNYQRFLAFIYGAKAATSPHDLAFFVRRINTIFDDPRAVENGARGITCANSACHGISIVGEAPPNQSDFPILSNAGDDQRLTINFGAATGFVNFLNPAQSSLFEYPTQEILRRVGIEHPGGLDFAVDSIQATDILTWAKGLRPDAQGFVRNWLVVGDFVAEQVNDQALRNEATVTPKIFDRGGGSVPPGLWDGFFSDSALIDLNVPFPRDETTGRIAYAVAYILNTDPFEQPVNLAITTDNPIQVFVDGRLAQQDIDGGDVNVFIPLASSLAAEGKTARIMVKLLQRANDAQFAFQAQTQDRNGLVLTDANSGIVFTLSANGGI